MLPRFSLSLHDVAKSGLQLRYHCTFGHFTHQLFDEKPERDLLSVTSTLSLLARRGRHGDAIRLFSRELLRGISPNQFTFGTVLSSATVLHDYNLGKQLHALVTKTGFTASDVFVGSSIVNHYAKLGSTEEAKKAFDDITYPNVVCYTSLLGGFLKAGRADDAVELFRRMPEKNAVSWNAMIAGCSKIGLNEVSVNLFVEMRSEGTEPTQHTFPCVFTAAANIAALGLGRTAHAALIKSLSRPNLYVGSSLISFYAKCGCMEDCVSVFNRLQEKNIVSWNALICGLAQNGRGIEALQFYRSLRSSSCMRPNDVTLLGVLFGCNHAGLVEDGYACFQQIKLEEPRLLRAEHYACVLNLLSRSGRFAEAEKFLSELPLDPGVGFWKSLLAGCQIHANTELATAAAMKLDALSPGDSSSYVLLSNVYSSVGSWERTHAVRQEMRTKEMDLSPGCSWVEIKNKWHVFLNGDRRHVRTDAIYEILKICLTDMLV